ncbi:hypothetical protein [Raineyella sp.]|uniref:hypothetical protein n=1 Tax=Raineyella sp. TaxID=1911550 RepID=UPI002B1EF784|nr:hypothetical protein [Raineyella sp.]MEA5153432.1 hypothetical protein [Raineyella sp.]
MPRSYVPIIGRTIAAVAYPEPTPYVGQRGCRTPRGGGGVRPAEGATYVEGRT